MSWGDRALEFFTGKKGSNQKPGEGSKTTRFDLAKTPADGGLSVEMGEGSVPRRLPPLVALPGLERRRDRPHLPSQGIVAKWVPGLVPFFDALRSAEGEALEAARAWQAAQPGGPRFRAVLDDHRHWTERHLSKGGPIPSREGPLWEHPQTQHELYVLAVQAQVTADVADRKLREVAPSFADDLDAKTDGIAAEIRALLDQANERADRVAYELAHRKTSDWAESSSLYVWCRSPHRAYRRRWPGSIPRDLSKLAFAAGQAVGLQLLVVPDAALDDLEPQR